MSANTTSTMFIVMLGWYDVDWYENPFAVSREEFYAVSMSKPYTRKQAWDYVKAARAKAEREGISLVDIEVLDADSRKTLWEWHR